MKPTILTLTALLLALAMLFGTATAAPAEKVAVIVGFRDLPEPALIHAHGGEIKYEYTIIPAIACRLPPAAAEALARNPRVEYIEPDLTVHALEDTLDWGVDRIDAEVVWGGSEDAIDVVSGNHAGDGVKVAVLDTGIDYNHPDLVDRYIGGYDFVNGDDDPMDDNGHGTHCAGIIAATDNDAGVIGTAPKVNISAYKVLDSSGTGYYSDVIIAIQEAVTDGANVISMSFGSSGDYPGLEDAFNTAFYDKGVLLVAAAGNEGNPPGRGDNVNYPARYDSVIAVAATTSSDARAKYSSTGPAVELAAPGDHILSTYPGGYATMSGTSMACPHVAGVAALVKSANGTLNNHEIRRILRETAYELGISGKDDLYGYGLVQAYAAVKAAGGEGSGDSGGGSDDEPGTEPIHIGDLDGTAIPMNVIKWQASATVTVHNSTDAVLPGVFVTGIWEELGRTVSGTTGNDGTVTFSSGMIKTADFASVNFSVTGASLVGYTYNCSLNHDPDIDSDGTTIMISKP